MDVTTLLAVYAGFAAVLCFVGVLIYSSVNKAKPTAPTAPIAPTVPIVSVGDEITSGNNTGVVENVPFITSEDTNASIVTTNPVDTSGDGFVDLPDDSDWQSTRGAQVFVNPKGDSKKTALLFGINKCSPAVFQGSSLPLRGCVNDTMHMRAWLSRIGFGKLYHYTDSDATIARFVASFKEVAKTTRPGDTILLQMSRHGMSLGADYMGTDPEVSSKVGKDTYSGDQGAVMHDGIIVDDCFWRIFSLLPKGVKIIYLNDSCHSGTQYKVADIVLPGTSPEGYNKPRSVGREYMPSKDNVLDTVQLEREFPAGRLAEFDLVSISGCQDWETSADAYIGRKYQGAMTAALLASLYRRPKSSPEELGREMTRLLKANGFPQQPLIVVEGDQSLLQKPLF
jgi:metacaspase-1